MSGFWRQDRKSTRLNSSHLGISYAVFCRHPDPPSFPTRRSSDLRTDGTAAWTLPIPGLFSYDPWALYRPLWPLLELGTRVARLLHVHAHERPVAAACPARCQGSGGKIGRAHV